MAQAEAGADFEAHGYDCVTNVSPGLAQERARDLTFNLERKIGSVQGSDASVLAGALSVHCVDTLVRGAVHPHATAIEL